MATFLIDYENVHGANGLKGIDLIDAQDVLIIFYSKTCSKIREEYMKHIRENGCGFLIRKLTNARKNALDFYIATECGRLWEKGETQIAIISNDNGFKSVLDYFQIDSDKEKVEIVQACNIESAILKFHSSANELRNAIVADRVSMIDLEVEYALLKERTAIKNSIKQLLDSTEYESRSAEIIAFAMERREVNKKVLYNSALHSFGKADGTAIYQIIKQAV